MEYALRHANDYRALLFVVADSPDHLKRGMADLALVLDLKEVKDRQDDEARFAAALRWLMEHPGWCLILDNVDDESAAAACENLVSKLYGGHVIITSRLTKWSMCGIEALDLDVLDSSSARDLLLERTPNRFHTDRDREAAEELAGLLDGLALGLEQAGAYIDTVQCSIREYVDLWRKGETEVTDWYDEELMKRLMKYPKSVVVTWNATVQRLGPAAESLLHLLAAFAPAPIPMMIITGSAAKPTVEKFLESGSGEASPLSARALLTKLAAFSMVKKSSEGAEQSLSLHRVVRDITWQRVAQDRRAVLLQTAANLFAATAPHEADRYENWVAWRALFPHAQCIWGMLQHHPRAHWNFNMLHGMALYHLGQGNQTEGEKLQRLTWELKSERLGPDNPEAIEAKNDLALLLSDQQDALRLLREALEGLEAAYQKDRRPRTEILLLATAFNVAVYLSEDSEAEALLRRCLAGFAKSSEAGPSHWRTLLTSRQLAYLLWPTDRQQEAEELASQTLALSRGNPSLGPEHKDTLDSVGQMARFQLAKGDMIEAGKLLNTELVGREKSPGLGPQHPSTLECFKTLVETLWQQKKPSLAEDLCRGRMRLWRDALGDDHPHVVECASLLVRVLALNGRVAEARRVEVECELALVRRQFYEIQARTGGQGPELLVAMGAWAAKLRDVGHFAEAESVYRRQIDGLRRSDGEGSLELAIALNNYGLLLRDQGKLDLALGSYEEALRIQERRAAGARDYDPKVPHRLNNVAMVLLMLGRVDEAKARLARAWSLKQGHHDVTSARVLWVRLAAALLSKEPCNLFLGQLKGLMAARESRVSSQVDDYWNVQSVLACLRPQLAPEHGSLLESIVHALNAGSHYHIEQPAPAGTDKSGVATPRLDDLAPWQTQAVVPLESPWPGPGTGQSATRALCE